MPFTYCLKNSIEIIIMCFSYYMQFATGIFYLYIHPVRDSLRAMGRVRSRMRWWLCETGWTNVGEWEGDPCGRIDWGLGG